MMLIMVAKEAGNYIIFHEKYYFWVDTRWKQANKHLADAPLISYTFSI